jgi:hypothetical protein
MGKLKKFGKSYLKFSTLGLIDIDKKSKKRASEKLEVDEKESTKESKSGMLGKLGKLTKTVNKEINKQVAHAVGIETEEEKEKAKLEERIELLEMEKEEYAMRERKMKIIEKYGEQFGNAVLNRNLIEGMTMEMAELVLEGYRSLYQIDEKYYFADPNDFGTGEFNREIIFHNEKVKAVKTLNKGIWIDMPKHGLIASLGKPADIKENVSKDKVKLKYLYGKSETSRGTTKYKTEVNLENDLVVGWKEL